MRKTHGIEIVGSSSDTGSGLTLERPGLRGFLNAVEDKNVDMLLLRSLDRLGRNIGAAIRYWNFLRERNVHVYTIMDGEIDLSIYESLQRLK